MAELTIERRAGVGLAAVMARRGVGADRVGAALGVAAPTSPVRRTGDGLALIGAGPGMWLAERDGAEPFWAETLRERLTGLASVSDQSSGYAIWRLSGEGAQTLLQRGVSIDLHPDAFRPGDSASTAIAHIAVVVWKVDDRPTFDVATFRSFADSFQQWLDRTSAAL